MNTPWARPFEGQKYWLGGRVGPGVGGFVAPTPTTNYDGDQTVTSTTPTSRANGRKSGNVRPNKIKLQLCSPYLSVEGGSRRSGLIVNAYFAFRRDKIPRMYGGTSQLPAARSSSGRRGSYSGMECGVLPVVCVACWHPLSLSHELSAGSDGGLGWPDLVILLDVCRKGENRADVSAYSASTSRIGAAAGICSQHWNHQLVVRMMELKKLTLDVVSLLALSFLDF